MGIRGLTILSTMESKKKTGSWPRRKPRALLVPEETAMKWQKAGNHSCYPNIKASYYQQRAAPSKHRRTIGLEQQRYNRIRAAAVQSDQGSRLTNNIQRVSEGWADSEHEAAK